MDDVKHTPGPYRAALRGTELIIEGGCTEVVAVLPTPTRYGYGVVSAEERGGNADRIAAALNDMDDSLNKAAPELLEACREFTMHYPSGINPFLDDARNVAIAAIAKAEGRR